MSDIVERLRSSIPDWHGGVTIYGQAADCIEELEKQLSIAETNQLNIEETHKITLREVQRESMRLQTENDSLRQQLAEALSVRENCTLVPTHELKKLQEQLADSEAERLEQSRLLGMSGEREAGLIAEIERLKGECLSLAIDATPGIQLTASQAREQQLREAFQTYIDEHEECTDADDWMAMTCPIEAHHVADEALALPQDTSALDRLKAQVAHEAGEVMREEIIEQCIAMGAISRDGAFVEEIRALPSVTLDELK